MDARLAVFPLPAGCGLTPDVPPSASHFAWRSRLRRTRLLRRIQTTTIGMSSQKNANATVMSPSACMNHGLPRLSRSWYMSQNIPPRNTKAISFRSA